MQKEIKHTAKDCPAGIYEVLYTDSNIPYLRCTSCEKENKDWVKWAEEYSSFWKEESRQSSKRDLPMCVLGYFCHKYKEHYGFDYVLSLHEKGLFFSQEFVIVKKIIKHISDYNTISQYIDWFFSEKCVKRRKKLLSISVLAAPALITEFKFFKQKSLKITRNTLLPQKMKEWILENAPSVAMLNLTDFGDLKIFLQGYLCKNYDKEDVHRFVERLKEKRIIMDNFEINRWSDS
jgi:hypothetical protein